MPKAFKTPKAAALRKPVKRLLIHDYKVDDPRTLRERECCENVNRHLRGDGNWPDEKGFCLWGTRNRDLREKKRRETGTERTPSGMTLRQQQFLEDVRCYEAERTGPAV
jgi:hypothetical protein